MLARCAMVDGNLDMAVERLDAALARVEAALVRSAAGASAQPSPDALALAALEQRHAALRQVLTESVGELDTLLAVADNSLTPDVAK